MDKYFICLANSYKHGGRCVAGIEIAFDTNGKPIIIRHPDGRPCWIRPISNEPDGSIPNEIAKDIKLFTVIKLTDVISRPNKAHVEDTLYSQMECRHGHFTQNEELLQLCLDKKHQNIFYFQGKAVPAQMVGRLNYSLMFIHPENIQAYIDESREKSKYRMKFTYYGSNYDFPITDPVFLEEFENNPKRFAQMSDVYLTLSLGLEFEGFHYKLVAAVIQNENSSKQEETNDWFKQYEEELARLIDQKKAVEDQIVSLRVKLIGQMEHRGVNKVDSDKFTIVYTPARTIMQFDGKAFRVENKDLYTHYCKPHNKEASIVVRRKQQKKEEDNY